MARIYATTGAPVNSMVLSEARQLMIVVWHVTRPSAPAQFPANGTVLSLPREGALPLYQILIYIYEQNSYDRGTQLV